MRLAVHQWGAGSRVVLVHGGGSPSRETWFAQKPLAERWALIAPDRPGHGDSPGDRNDFALDADLLVEQVLTGSSHLVGYSYGSIGAMLAAARAAELVRSLTVIEPPTPQVAVQTPEVKDFARQLDLRVGARSHDPEALIDWFFPFIGVPLTTPDPFPDWLKRGAEAIDLGITPTRAQLPLAELRDLGLPMMVVSGAHHPCHEAICDAIADATGARRERIPGFGHLVPAAGERFNTLLEEFWTSADA